MPASGFEVDPRCTRTSNTEWFDSTQDPVAPAAWYIELLTRGWMPLKPENFVLPQSEKPNPCNEPAPVITAFAAGSVLSTSVTFTWTTSNDSDSQIIYRDLVTNEVFQTTVDTSRVKSHSVRVTGLKANTRYAFKAKSTSISGRSTESTELSLKTAR